jgi:hypothetical protein
LTPALSQDATTATTLRDSAVVTEHKRIVGKN